MYKILESKDIKPSIHRIKILEYLLNNHVHPSADTIYQAVVKELPTLSKTTVYNTLNLFVEKKIANAIVIEGNEIRYDVIEYSHGHFKCNICKNIIDFQIDEEKFGLEKLGNIDINEIQFYIKGICEKCKDKQNI